MTTIRELVTKIGFDVDQDQLDSFDNSLDDVLGTLAKVGAAAATAAGALFGVAQNAAKTGDRVAKAARDADVGVEEYQALEFAFGQAGISAGEFESSMERFSRRIGDAQDGTGQAAGALDELGVSLTDSEGNLKDNETLMKEISQAMGGVDSQARRASLSAAIFGRSGIRMGTAMADGGEEIQKNIELFEKYGGAMSEEGAANSEEFNDTMSELWVVIGGLQFDLAEKLIPTITDLVARFRDWILENRELIASKIDSFVQGLMRFISMTVDVVLALARGFRFLANFVGGTENAIKLLVGSIVAWKALQFARSLFNVIRATRLATAVTWLWNSALLANPILLVIGLIAAIAAALWAWFGDNDEVIARLRALWEDFIAFGKRIFQWLINFVVSLFKSGLELVVGIWGWLWERIKMIFDLIGGMVSWLVDHFTARLELISQVWSWLWERVESIFEAIGDLIGWLQEKFDEAMELVGDIWDGLWERIDSVFEAIGDSISWLWERFKDIGKLISDLWSSLGKSISNIFSSVWQSLRDGAVSAINWLIRQINRIPGVNIGQIGTGEVETEDVAGEPVTAEDAQAAARKEVGLSEEEQRQAIEASDNITDAISNLDITLQEIGSIMMDLRDAAAAGQSKAARVVNIDSEIIVNVPPGFEAAQERFIRTAARDAFREEYERNIEDVLIDNPDLE